VSRGILSLQWTVYSGQFTVDSLQWTVYSGLWTVEDTERRGTEDFLRTRSNNKLLETGTERGNKIF
jgi:hypothetical protein